jgi:hypothetical protein
MLAEAQQRCLGWVYIFGSYQHRDQLVCEDAIHTHRNFQILRKSMTQNVTWINNKHLKDPTRE